MLCKKLTDDKCFVFLTLERCNIYKMTAHAFAWLKKNS